MGMADSRNGITMPRPGTAEYEQQIADLVATAPPLTDDQLAVLRRIFSCAPPDLNKL